MLPVTDVPCGEAMGSIITIATQKGGAGTTTLARVLSADLVHHGWRAAVIDADPN